MYIIKKIEFFYLTHPERYHFPRGLKGGMISNTLKIHDASFFF